MKFSEKFTIFLGIVLVGTFVIGLAWSISTGLAGFWKGLPFWIIVIFCLSLLVYDSLKSIKKRHLNSILVRRRGRVYIINKKNPKFKARQK